MKFREVTVRFCKRFEYIIIVLLKFILGLYIFGIINDIGHIRPELEIFYNLFPPTMMFAIGFAALPATLANFLVILAVTVNYSVFLEIAAIIFVFLISILLFYARMAPKESILIILTLVAYNFGILYIIPLIAGLYFSITAVIPVAIGIFIFYFIPYIQNIVETTEFTEISVGGDITEIDIGGMPETFGDIYEALVTGLTEASEWIFTAFIFAMVIIMVYVISRLAIDYAKELAIGLGCAAIIFGHLMASAFGGVSVAMGQIILMTIISGVLVWLGRFFDPMLDYKRAEYVQFEDDDNYYYVRLIPKIQMISPVGPPTPAPRRPRPVADEDEY